MGSNIVRVMASGAIDVNHRDEIYDRKVSNIIANALNWIMVRRVCWTCVCLLKLVKMNEKHLFFLILERVRGKGVDMGSFFTIEEVLNE